MRLINSFYKCVFKKPFFKASSTLNHHLKNAFEKMHVKFILNVFKNAF
jgi:hypothetical protein